MDSTANSIVLAIVVGSILLFLFVILRLNGKRRNLPPGPRPWPIIGNLNAVIGPLPHHSLHSLSKIYGPILHLRFGSHQLIVSSSVETASLFLKTHDLTFSNRPLTAAGKYTAFDRSIMSWSQYGPYFRLTRRIYQMELFSEKRMQESERIRSEEAVDLVLRIKATNGVAIDMREMVWCFTIGIICRTAFGMKFVEEDSHRPITSSSSKPSGIVSASEFRKMLDEFFFLNGVYTIGDSIPWLEWFDIGGYVRRMKAIGQKFDQFMESVLEEHERKKLTLEVVGNETSRSVIEVLMEMTMEGKTGNHEYKLTRKQVKALTMEVIAGGTESSSVTLEWAMSELLRNPKILRRATNELDDVVGKHRLVVESDIPNLPYIEAVVKETFRLHPVAPLLTPHVSREDCIVAGYDIPAGTRLLVNTWAIQRDPDVWDLPEEFMPERFLEGRSAGIDMKGKHFELLPFSSGRRMCPGSALGLKSVQLGLANLVHCFDWEAVTDRGRDGMISMEETFGMSLKKTVPLRAVAVPRLSPEAYQL